ncbi:MAG: DUF2029 domain-containing protein [Clostridiales bacterium]|nr:DUF2029 domain-containing protein [Clostridiales bacterium]
MKMRRLENRLNQVLPAKRLQLLSAFLILASFATFIIVSILNPGTTFASVLFAIPGDRTDTFMDFYNSVYDTMYGPYEHEVIYPPLCCLIFKMFGSLLPRTCYVKEWVERGGFRIKSFQETQFSLLLFFAFFIILFIGGMQKPLNKRGYFEKMLITLAMFLSTPVIYALERGNIIIYSFVFLLLFFVCYDDNRAWLREAGYIFLAMSAAIKLYPAIFGLLLLRDRKIKEAVRTIIYGVIFAIGPFAFFGGIEAIRMFLESLGKFKETDHYGISFSNGISFMIFGLTGYHLILTIGGLLAAACLIIEVFFVDRKNENNWKPAALLSLSMLGLVENCGKYMVIFMVIPWLLIFKPEGRLRLIDYIYVLMMTIILSPLPMGIASVTQAHYDANTMIICWTAIIMSVVLMLDVIICFIKGRKEDTEKPV